MSDDTLSLEFLGRQQTAILEEMREMRRDFALAYRQVTDTQLSIMQALDRRVSDTKDDLETTIKMELLGDRNVSDDRIEKVLTDFEQHLVERFDARYARQDDA